MTDHSNLSSRGDELAVEAENRRQGRRLAGLPPEDPELLICLDNGPDCVGPVEYRMPLSGTGKSFPRCDHHWFARLEFQHGVNERYPQQPPANWSPLDAGETWDEEY